MPVCFSIKMLHILVLCPVLLIAGVQTLTIDSQLGTSVEDCFERVSIGEQLPSSAIYRNVSELTTRECEQICKQDKQCQSYDYGVGAKGNATCDLSTSSEKEVKGSLTRHPDYDVYVRRFQCEQSPPSPLQPLADELDEPSSNDRPQHRPVFRPDIEDRPLVPDYIVSSDIDPYNVGSKPQSYRPDDISQRPAYDVGPSYGDFKPQDIPYPRPRPDPYRPNDPYRPDPYRPRPDPYKPDRPNDPYRPNKDPQKPKPDTNDVLHFDGYGPPLKDPDPYRPEKPNYNYIIRPNKKPKPENYYTKPLNDYNTPVGPPFKPKPDPEYNYNNQYASNYQNQNDNSVYVEIYDPPRPYVPIKDRPIQHNYDQGFLGYGTYSSQNSYTQNSQYTGSITEIGYDKPQRPYGQNVPYKPNKGSYGQSDQGSYDKRPENNPQTGYQRPNDRYKPQNQNYGSNQNSYGSSHGQNYDSYGESYRPSYNQDSEPGYQKPQKPGYNKPYGGDKGDYGNHDSYEGNQSYNSHKGSYGLQSSYGSQDYGQNSYNQVSGSHGYDSQSYGNSQSYGDGGYGFGSYGGNKGSYSSNQGSYGSNQASYGSYGSYSGSVYGNRPVYDYETHRPGYGNENPAYNNQKPSYGNSKPEYDRPKPGYGNPKPEYDQKPGYAGSRPEYDNPKPGYGNSKPEYDPSPGYGGSRPYDNPKPGYGSPKPDYDRPGYGNEKPEYDIPKPGYGNPKPEYESPKPGYGNPKPEYESPKPGYGNPKPEYESPKPGYGNPKPEYESPKPGYGNDRPDPDYVKPADYGKPGGSQRPGYGSKPDDAGYDSQRPDVKPVYEYELDKPSNVPTYISRPGGEIVTSRPVVIGDYERPVYKEPGISFAAPSSPKLSKACTMDDGWLIYNTQTRKKYLQNI